MSAVSVREGMNANQLVVESCAELIPVANVADPIAQIGTELADSGCDLTRWDPYVLAGCAILAGPTPDVAEHSLV
jgi:hypothetical protein